MSIFNANKVIQTVEDVETAVRRVGMRTEFRGKGTAMPHLVVSANGSSPFIIGQSELGLSFGSSVLSTSPDWERLMSWNAKAAFASASYIQDNRPRYLITYALISEGGLMRHNVQQLAQTWPSRVQSFLKHMGLSESSVVRP